MAAVGDLQRVAALVRRLTPLAEVERGDPIRADDWNLVVGALVELARATLGAGDAADAGGVPPHDHADEVKLGWLAPPLRALIEKGSLADPANVGKLLDFDRRVGRLGGRLDEVEKSVTLVRDRVAEVVTRDLTRAGEVTDVRRVVDGLADGREDVAELRTTLDGVRTDVLAAIEAARRLTVDGQVVDLPALLARIASLEAARDRLRLPNGETLDAAALEERFAGLVGTLVTEEELKQALDARTARLAPEERAALEQSLAAAARAQVNAAMKDVVGAMRAEIEQRLTGIDGAVAAALAGALPGIVDAAAAKLRPEVAAAVDAANRAVMLQVERAIAEAASGLRGELGGKLEELAATLAKRILVEAEAAARAAVAELDKRVASLEDRVGKQEQRFGAIDGVLAKLQIVIADGLREGAAERTRTEQRLLAEMQQRDEALEKRLDARLDAIEQALRARIDTLLADRLAALKSELEQLAATASAREVAVLATRIRGEMHDVARDEVATVDARVHRILDDRLAPR